MTGEAPELPTVQIGSESPLAVGGTPLRALGMTLDDGRQARIHLKLEGENPGGSVKDRTAAALFADVTFRSRLRPGGFLVESSSGNLAVSMATFARAADVQFVAVVDSRTSPVMLERLSEVGATIETVDVREGDWLAARLARVQQICRDEPNAVWTNQYANPANPVAHFMGTGQELLRQAPEPIRFLFIAVSTCGTLAGIASLFRLASPLTKIIAVDVEGSTVFGGRAGPRALTGIGASRAPEFDLDGLVDGVVKVSTEEAVATCHAVGTKAGSLVGGSSGAVIAAARRVALRESALGGFFAICPDRGENYARTLFDHNWIRSQGINLGLQSHNLFFTP